MCMKQDATPFLTYSPLRQCIWRSSTVLFEAAQWQQARMTYMRVTLVWLLSCPLFYYLFALLIADGCETCGVSRHMLRTFKSTHSQHSSHGLSRSFMTVDAM